MKHPVKYFDLYCTGSSRWISADSSSRTTRLFISGSSGLGVLCYGGGLNSWWQWSCHPSFSRAASGCVVAAQNPAGEVGIGVPVVLAEQILLECGFVDAGAQVLHNSTQVDFGVFQAGSTAR